MFSDFDGDGHVDLLVVSKDKGLLLYRGSNGGYFDEAGEACAPGVEFLGASAMTAGDVDGDGDLDVVGTGADVVTATLNPGDGVFDLPVEEDPDVGTPIVFDVDLDGHPDLVSSTTGASGFAWRPGLGDGTFGPPGVVDIGAAPGLPAILSTVGALAVVVCVGWRGGAANKEDR